jgi:ribosome-binding protein aMBF1 (putative translation factor)
MIKTQYICDICGSEVDQKQLILVKPRVDVDVCYTCTLILASRAIKNKVFNLKPWCKNCKGKGFVEESDYDHVDRKKVECNECSI